MFDNLRVLGRMLAAYADKLMGGTQTEREVATVLDALEVAIKRGATAELAQLVEPWTSAKLVDGVRAMPQDDQAREDVIADLANEAQEP